MRIKEIDIDGFGVWNGLKLPDLSEQALVIYGPNEAGKTTVMQFVRAVLYGFTPLRRSRYLPPVNGGRPGGRITVANESGEFSLSRYANLDDPPENLGHVSVVDAHGLPRDPSHLDNLLAKVDEPTFSNVFALGLREIQELGSLDDTSAADHLYKLTTGLDRVSLIDVMRDLGQARDRLLKEDDAASQITQLLARREKLQADLHEFSSAARKWTELAAQRSGYAQEVASLQASIDANLVTSRQIQAALEVQGPWNARAEADKQLALLRNVREIKPEQVERLEDYCKQIARYKSRMKKIAAHRKAMAQEAKAIDMNRTLLAQAPRIEALNEHGQWIATLQTNLVKLRDDLKKLDAEIGVQTGTVKSSIGPGATLDDLPKDIVAVLRRPSQLMKEEGEKLEKIKQESEAAKLEAETVVHQFESSVQARRVTDLNKSIHETGQKVALLRKRLQVEERLDQLTRRNEELSFDNDEISEFEETPMRVTALLGSVFCVGVMLFFLGVFGPSLNIHQDMSFLWVVGIAVSGGSVFGKLMVDRRAQDDVSDSRRQLDQAKHQLADVKQQRDELDAELGPGSGSGALDLRLRDAEMELRELEKLVPAKTEYDTVQQRAELAERRLAASHEAVKEARNRWKNALRSVGLPEDFAPHRVKQVVRNNDAVLELRRRRDARRDELDQRERELLVLSTRTTQLLADVRIEPTSDNPQAQLRQLAQALSQEKELLDLKQGYVKKHRKLGHLRSRTVSKLRSLGRKRRDMLEAAGVDSLKAFRQASVDWANAQTLLKQRDELSDKVTALLEERYSDEEIAAIYAREGNDLQSRWDQRVAWTQEVQLRLAALHEQRGANSAEMKSLASDRRLSFTMLELASVERQLEAVTRRWQVLGVISRVLDTVRQAYETHRQPETLREASKYLARLTSGQYPRVWMPIDRRELLAEDNKGQSLSLEVLSRGTREAVYISLRLALASSFARRGAKLPLVLDDVLVNFDTGRVRCAAEVFHDFAETGHQIIMFTCHEHISRIFEEARVSVRTLPVRQNMVASSKKPKKKKEVPPPVAELPPPAIVPEEPPLRLELPNSLFSQASQEEIWYDPTNAYEMRKPIVVPVLNLPDSWALAPIAPVKRTVPKLNLPDAWPVAAILPAKRLPTPKPIPQLKLPDAWPLAEMPLPKPKPIPEPAAAYQVYSFRYLPDSWPLATEPATVVAPPAPVPVPVVAPPIPVPVAAKPVVAKTVAVVEPPKPVPLPAIASPRRRFTWDSPDLYWEGEEGSVD
jgi:uncharacterized protein YhaN